MISNNILYFFLVTLFFIVGCGEENIPEVVETNDDPVEQKEDFKFKSYRRIIPIINLGRTQLEKSSDIDGAGRNLLKTFDKNKSEIGSSSQE